MPFEWYYENVQVVPLMIKEGLMTFRVTLPFTDDSIYQRYMIQTFAVPIDDSGSRARARVQEDIAYGDCIGLLVCANAVYGPPTSTMSAGPRWRDAFPCERGLITGHEPDRDMCRITVTTNNENDSP